MSDHQEIPRRKQKAVAGVKVDYKTNFNLLQGYWFKKHQGMSHSSAFEDSKMNKTILAFKSV